MSCMSSPAGQTKAAHSDSKAPRGWGQAETDTEKAEKVRYQNVSITATGQNEN